MGEYFYWSASAYLLGVANGIDNGTKERFDVKARFSPHLGSIIGLGDQFDFYPGLDFILALVISSPMALAFIPNWVFQLLYIKQEI